MPIWPDIYPHVFVANQLTGTQHFKEKRPAKNLSRLICVFRNIIISSSECHRLFVTFAKISKSLGTYTNWGEDQRRSQSATFPTDAQERGRGGAHTGTNNERKGDMTNMGVCRRLEGATVRPISWIPVNQTTPSALLVGANILRQ